MPRYLMPSTKPFALLVAVALAVVAGAWSLAAAHGGRPPSGEILPGDFFPAATLMPINTPGSAPVDLADVMGTKPVVLVYWIAGHERSEGLMVEVQELVQRIGRDKVALYGLAVERPGREADAIRERIRALGIEVPVLNDEGFVLGRKLGVQSVPNVVILDESGRLRLANGASLAQTLEYKLDLAEGIRRVAQTGRLGTYGYLDRYFPVTELVGKSAPDFTTETLIGDEARRWSENLFERNKLNVLIFWSVDCPHCRKSLPEIAQWLRQNPDESLNVVSAAYVTDPATTTKTKEFLEQNELGFTTVKDIDRQIADKFLVTTTPTILIVGPDGTIDSVMLSDVGDFGKTITDRKRALLQAS